MKYTIPAFVIMTALISFLGWLLENIWLALTKGYINNRNMNLPFLFGYGLFIVALYLIVGTPESFLVFLKKKSRISRIGSYLIYFMIVLISVSVGEIILGTLVEYFCGFEYWNYEVLAFHVTKYTSLPTSIGFAVMIMFIMDKCFLPVMNAIASIPYPIALWIAIPLGVALILDFLISFKAMYALRKGHELWRVYVRHSVPLPK